jgi:putative ABC transport system ATP-binding protein
MEMAVIDLQDVSKLYGFGDATTLALDEINVSIEKGEFVAVMGPSGCGKSTLMNIIGLLDRPSHGTYSLNSKRVDRLRPNKAAKLRRDTLGFIFQSFNLLPRLNVLDNVALPLSYTGMSTVKRLKIASNMLDRVGMQSREYFMPSQLSGGQVQSAAIARALVNDPSVLIADEPTGNLDSNGSLLVMELLSELHKTGHTIIFVTHNPELTRYATRVLYMHDGAIIHDEQTKVGEIAKRAKRQMYKAVMSEEDDLAGVSTLMKVLPEKSAPAKTKRKSNKRKKAPAKKRTI